MRTKVTGLARQYRFVYFLAEQRGATTEERRAGGLTPNHCAFEGIPAHFVGSEWTFSYKLCVFAVLWYCAVARSSSASPTLPVYLQVWISTLLPKSPLEFPLRRLKQLQISTLRLVSQDSFYSIDDLKKAQVGGHRSDSVLMPQGAGTNHSIGKEPQDLSNSSTQYLEDSSVFV